MRDVMYLGPVPADEPCAQVGDEGYELVAREECGRYIRLIRRVKGPEPAGARLRIKANPHDLGTYLEVVCEFDDADPVAAAYALDCENDGPASWDDDRIA